MTVTKGSKPSGSGRRSNVTLLFRDNFTISTWISIGAVLQSVAFSIFGRIAFLPAISILLYRFADAYAIKIGIKHNHYMDGIVKEMASAQFPGETQGSMEDPADSDVCVFMIGSKVNHPFGLLAPGYKETGAHFMGMVNELKENSEKYGFLGSKSLVGAESPTNNETVSIMYFKSSEHVQAYATGPLHRKAVVWWTKHVELYPHIGIFHELYHVPRKNWETLYAQMKPMMAGATQHRVQTSMEGKEGGSVLLKNPLVASRGVLKSSLGRMGRLPGTFSRRDLLVQDGRS